MKYEELRHSEDGSPGYLYVGWALAQQELAQRHNLLGQSLTYRDDVFRFIEKLRIINGF